MKTIGNIAAAILIFFGVLFIWGAFSSQGQAGWIVVGLISVMIGLVIIYFLNRKPAVASSETVTYKVDLPGNVNMQAMKCQSCGGTLAAENITVVNGAPMVNCPYCHTVYQLSEEPKW